MEKPKQGIYRHYKGGMYRLVDIVKHSETLEDLVLYEALYDNPRSKFWVRPLSMWSQEVENKGKKVKRFEFVKEV